jgi:hypothetical protein
MKSDEGVAIQSTVEKLRDSLMSVHQPEEYDFYRGIHIGYVKYGHEVVLEELAEQSPNPQNPKVPRSLSVRIGGILAKRKSFEHEKEIRLWIETDFGLNDSGCKYSDDDQTGIRVDISVKELINNIYVNPDSPVWLKGTIQSVIKRLGYDIDVIKSNLYSLDFE